MPFPEFWLPDVSCLGRRAELSGLGETLARGVNFPLSTSDPVGLSATVRHFNHFKDRSKKFTIPIRIALHKYVIPFILGQ